MGWSVCVTKELVQGLSLSRWPESGMLERVPGEVGQFQVSDKIRGMVREWEAEVGEVVIREEEDQVQTPHGKG